MKAIDRLYKYLENQNIKPTVFEKEIGFSSGYLSNMKKRSADMGESIMNKVIEYCHLISPDWLLTGQGTMLRSSVPELASEGRLPVEGGVSPPVCGLCVAKDETIAALKAQIEVQSEYIGLLKEQCPPGSGQKRKQECA